MKPAAMCQRIVLFSVLVLVTSSASESPPKSTQDQYQQRPAQTQTNGQKTLHRVSLTSTGLHDLSLIPGQVQAAGNVPVKSENVGKDRTREKRDYVRWYSSVNSQYNPPIHAVHIQGFTSGPQQPIQTRWRGQTQSQPLFRHPYQIFVPIWGNPSRIPIFFPPKPIIFNPGYPPSNYPTRPESSTQRPSDEVTDGFPISLPPRFGDPNNPEYGPVWGVVEAEESGGGSRPTTTQRPRPRPTTTRPTARPTMAPVEDEDPPLFHKPTHGEKGEGNAAEAPLPSEEELQEVFTTRRSVTTTTQRPARELNRCVWSIISCCSPTDNNIRYNCFENLGCPGAFWDRNPCSREVIQAALNAANAFYDNQ